MLLCLGGVAVANGVAALAPNLVVFTASQVVMRGFASGGLIVAGIAAVEEAPEGARAYSVALLGLAGGFGYAFAVTLLPAGRPGRRGVASGLRRLCVDRAVPAELRPPPGRDAPLRRTRRPARPPRPGGRAVRPLVRGPLLGARDHRLPLRHLRRTVVAADQRLPEGHPGLLGPGHHHLPGDHPGLPRAGRHRHRGPPGRDPGPAAGRRHRPVHRHGGPDDLLPLRRRAFSGCRQRRPSSSAASPPPRSGRSAARCSRPRSGAPPTPSWLWPGSPAPPPGCCSPATCPTSWGEARPSP